MGGCDGHCGKEERELGEIKRGEEVSGMEWREFAKLMLPGACPWRLSNSSDISRNIFLYRRAEHRKILLLHFSIPRRAPSDNICLGQTVAVIPSKTETVVTAILPCKILVIYS